MKTELIPSLCTQHPHGNDERSVVSQDHQLTSVKSNSNNAEAVKVCY